MGRQLYSEEINSGRNSKGNKSDDIFVKCSRCRFMVKVNRHTQGRYGSHQGWGLKYSDTTHASGDVTDPIVTSGCPQCGTFLYK